MGQFRMTVRYFATLYRRGNADRLSKVDPKPVERVVRVHGNRLGFRLTFAGFFRLQILSSFLQCLAVKYPVLSWIRSIFIFPTF